MSPDRIWILLGKKRSGEATPEELGELEALLPEQEEDGYASELMDKIWEAPLRPVPDMDAHKGVWHRIQKQVYAEEGRPGGARILFLRKWRVAAGFLLIAGATAAWYLQHADGIRKTASGDGEAHARTNQVATQAGSRTRLELPDGTQVWLNANSQLTYGNKSFGAEEREVTLSGEAFFDVVKNEKVPFIIHTRDLTIRVLGTSFNVRAYPKERTVETALIRGLVEITTRRDPDRRIMLKPDEKIIVPVDLQPESGDPGRPAGATVSSLYSIVKLRKDSTQTVPEIVWTKNKLEFDNELFAELAPKMENWFNIRIHFRDEEIKKRRFSGVIEKETLKETLDAMRLSGHFSYQITGNELWIGAN
jgi:transmembrane sensor